MEFADIIIRSVLLIIMIYAGWLALRLVRALFRWTLNLGRNVKELPRKAGSAAAAASIVAKTVKDGFAEGYKSRR